jgi:hypothetical protein
MAPKPTTTPPAASTIVRTAPVMGARRLNMPPATAEAPTTIAAHQIIGRLSCPVARMSPWRTFRTFRWVGSCRRTYSSSICLMTGASATTWAPSSTRIVRTPWLERPTRRMSPDVTRITVPLELITNMSWSFEPM